MLRRPITSAFTRPHTGCGGGIACTRKALSRTDSVKCLGVLLDDNLKFLTPHSFPAWVSKKNGKYIKDALRKFAGSPKNDILSSLPVTLYILYF